MKLNYFNAHFLYILFFSVCFTTLVHGQNADERMGKMTPPSPEAASIARSGIYPVSMFTGAPGISIPLYDVQIRDVKVPISLEYHGSGIKVNDLASFVGLGWNLSAGGVINRTVMGLPDDSPKGWLYNNIKKAVNINEEDYLEVDAISAQFSDSEPDLFYYSFMGMSGRFIFDQARKIQKITQNDLKIEFDQQTFKITDTKGNTFLFEAKAYHASFSSANNKIGYPITSWYLSKIILQNKKDSITFNYKGNSESNIKTFDHNISLGIEYDGNLNGSKTTEINNTVFFENSSDLYLKEINFPNGRVRFVSSLTRKDYGGFMLDSVIVENNRNVLKRIALEHDHFFLDTGYNFDASIRDKYRLKLLGVKDYGTGRGEVQQSKLLYNEQYKLPPRNNFGVDLWGYYNGQVSNRHLMPLDDNDKQYEFDTGASGIARTDITNPADRRSNEDYMKAGMLKRIYHPTGGYTDFDFEANRILVDKTMDDPGGSLSAFAGKDDKPEQNYRVRVMTSPVSVAQNASKPAQLKIHLPVWGSITQPFAEFRNLSKGNMLRFTRFPTDPANTTFNVELIKGDQYELRTNINANPSDPNDNSDDYVQLTLDWPGVGIINIPEVQKGPGLRIKSIKSYSENNVLVKQDEYRYGKDESGNGEIRFFNYLFKLRKYPQDYMMGDLTHAAYRQSTKLEIGSKPLLSYSDIGGNTVVYPIVTKYEMSSSGDNGKSVYNYDFDMDDKDYFNQRPDPQLIVNSAWENGQLLSEKNYRRNADNTYTLINEKNNKYAKITLNTIFGLKVGRKTLTRNATDLNGLTITKAFFSTFYYYYDYPIPSGLKKLTESSEIDYLNNGNIGLNKLKKFYYAADARILPGRVESTDSKGDLKIEITRYAQDKGVLSAITPGESSAIDTLLKNNRVDEILEKERYANTAFTERSHFEFGMGNGINDNGIWLRKLRHKIQNNPEEDRYIISTYDIWGNALTRNLLNGAKETFLWDYNGSYLTAEIKNAELGDIGYTGFEADSKGGWLYTGTAIPDLTAPVGTNVYRLSGGIVNKKGLDAAKAYILTYWARGVNANLISGTAANLIKNKGDWGLYQLTLNGITELNLSGDGVDIDELKIYPKQASMVTYNYIPLVGMSSHTDDKGMINYYEYDDFLRLKNIKDQDGNIIKNYQYHFRN